MLSHRCLSVLSVGWVDQGATWYRGRPRPWQHCVRLGPNPQNLAQLASQFSPHVFCGQTAGWIRMPLVTEQGLDPGHIVLDGAQLLRKSATAPSPSFLPMSIVAKRSLSHLLMSSCTNYKRSHKKWWTEGTDVCSPVQSSKPDRQNRRTYRWTLEACSFRQCSAQLLLRT